MPFMKWFYWILFAPLLLLASPTDSWLHDYDKAINLAKTENRPVYLFVGADVCRFCDIYKEKTLSDAEVMKTLSEQHILLYLSRDQHPIPPHFATKGVPHHYFIDPQGRVYFHAQGSFEIPGFHLMLDEAELNR